MNRSICLLKFINLVALAFLYIYNIIILVLGIKLRSKGSRCLRNLPAYCLKTLMALPMDRICYSHLRFCFSSVKTKNMPSINDCMVDFPDSFAPYITLRPSPKAIFYFKLSKLVRLRYFICICLPRKLSAVIFLFP